MIRNPQRAELSSVQDEEAPAPSPEPEISTGFNPLTWRESHVQEEFHGAGGRQVLGSGLTILAALWLGYCAWAAGRALGDQPISSPEVAQWLALAALAESARPLRTQITELRPRVPEEMKKRFEEFSEQFQVFGGGAPQGPPSATAPRVTVASVTGRLRTLFSQIDGVDLAPTTQQTAAAEEVIRDAKALQLSWVAFKTGGLSALNQELQGKGLPVIAVPK